MDFGWCFGLWSFLGASEKDVSYLSHPAAPPKKVLTVVFKEILGDLLRKCLGVRSKCTSFPQKKQLLDQQLW